MQRGAVIAFASSLMLQVLTELRAPYHEPARKPRLPAERERPWQTPGALGVFNVKAVSEIEELHAKVDALAAREEELLDIKRRQVALLEKLATTCGEETR